MSPALWSCPLIALARHASSTWTGTRYAGRSDPPLSEAGKLEAAALAARVARAGILAPEGSVVVTSPLARARDTARAVASTAGRRLVVSDDWAEVDFGELEGLTFDEARTAWPDGIERLAAGDAALDWPGGDAHADVTARVARGLDQVRSVPAPVLVVAHGFVLRAALALLAVRPGARTDAALRPGQLIVLRPDGERWRVGR